MAFGLSSKGNELTQRTPILELQPNEYVEGVYAIYNCQLGQTRGGKPYIKCILGDRTGRTPGRMWNTSEQLFETLPTDGFVHIEGTTQAYQGEMQIIIQNIRAVTPAAEDLANLLPHTKHDVEKMYAAVTKVIQSIQNPAIRTLGECYLSDEALMQRFRRAPAAMSLHHAYIGGLLEHTVSLMRLAHVMCPLYPQLSRDLVMFGIFVHDLGKCAELTWETGFNYSDDGHLVGHIARGMLWLQQKADQCAASGTRIPEPILRVLHHIILSHHGKPEFGALKVPATPEAIAVSLLDNLDAKLHMAISATRGDDAGKDLGSHFTEKVWALETRLYRPDPTTLVDDETLPA